MPVGQAPVRRAEAADHPGVAKTLASAFADDPGFAWLLDWADDRERRQELFFRTDLQHLVPDRRQVWVSDGGEAVAIWAPPDCWSVPPATVARESAAMVRVFRRRLPLALRYLIRIERSHPKEPHWYLNWLGAVPERQGRGLGSALLRPVLALCDRDRVGAYLEASSDRSAKLYERHGFRTVETFDMPGGGPPIRRMWRDPGGA